jgi:flagellar hook-associated protein 2
VPGFDSQKDADTMISQVGLVLDKDGHLSVDDTVFNNAVAGDYAAMLSLIGDEGVGSTDSTFVQFDTTDTTTKAGPYEVQVDFAADGTISAARLRKQGEGDDAWRAASVDGSTIIGAKGNPEQWLQLTATADSSKAGTAYTQGAVVEVKRGFAGALYQQFEALLDPTNGPLAIKETQYQGQITALNKQITNEQARLDKMEKNLKARYAVMESTLAQLDSLRSAYSAMNLTLGYGTTAAAGTSSSSKSSSSK